MDQIAPEASGRRMTLNGGNHAAAPACLQMALALLTVTYLVVVFGVKRLFFNRYLVGRPLNLAIQHGGRP